MKIENAIFLKRTIHPEIHDIFMKFQLAKEMHIMPWEMNKLPKTTAQEWLIILGEMNKPDRHGN